MARRIKGLYIHTGMEAEIPRNFPQSPLQMTSTPRSGPPSATQQRTEIGVSCSAAKYRKRSRAIATKLPKIVRVEDVDYVRLSILGHWLALAAIVDGVAVVIRGLPYAPVLWARKELERHPKEP